MKVRINYVEDVSDGFRRAINRYHGKPGMATRQEVKDWFWTFGQSMNDDLQWDDDEEVDS